MRTRFLSKLTNGEVEEYLTRNDLIFVPVGVTETHGALPLDSETVLAEAVTLKMAEETDGLVLHNLPYFFAGATPTGRGTVQMSIKDGMAYLDKIAESLLKQGFRRQVYFTSHGPAYLTVSSMVRDFFDRTKVPVLYIDMIMAVESIKDLSFNFMEKFHEMTIGAYSILGRLEDVPLNVSESNSVTYDVNKMMKAMQNIPAAPLGKLAYQSGAIGYYFDEASTHMVTPLLKTAEEREALAAAGVEAINEIVKKLDMNRVVQSLKEVDEYTKNESIPKYGEWLL
ncbi:creatininase family protein [Bacillus sp. FJAT-50079]|uniref:creatininase family protein n=1 Tax=Bacillus sp. FJAT-50079 TaxID=2833577 RepID=UPI001BC9D40A|nr:creatininase family protein [Bacillus sp. FJAT-50079]MBS4207994.1 creatininase family protein [Bacillus sp. FJAT-50079]